jgi:hypothetical protein
VFEAPKLRGLVSVIPCIMELPKNEAVGAPAGVKEATEEGGGPAGVVEGLSPRKENPVP